MKKSHLIAICAAAIVACGISLAQQPNTTDPAPLGGTPATVSPTPNLRYDPASPGRTAVTPTAFARLPNEEVKPEDLSIEQLIEAMEKTRAEIVEREKKNQARLKVLQDKVGKVKVRMDTFTGSPQGGASFEGLIPAPAVPLSPPTPKG